MQDIVDSTSSELFEKRFEWFKGWLSASCSSLFALEASLESGWYGLHPLLNGQDTMVSSMASVVG